MATTPGCARGAWTALEDKTLMDYIKANDKGEWKWRDLPERAGLKRSGTSCRLRWLNYLNPDIKKGAINADEEDLIIRLHKLLGDRWSLIAGRLPGRTDDEIKNHWNTFLCNKVQDTPPPKKEATKNLYPESSTNSNTTPQPLSYENHGEEAMGETSDNM